MATRFQDEVNASDQKKRHNAGLERMRRIFKSSFNSVAPVTNYQYLGKDANGNPQYRIYFVASSGAKTWRNYSLVGGKFEHASTVAAQVVSQGKKDAAQLSSTKQRWLSWLASNRGEMTQNDFVAFKNRIENWSGSPAGLDQMMHLVKVNAPHGATAYVDGDDEGYSNEFDIGSYLGGGGGGGGGFAGPVYVKPDKRVVEDIVKGMQTSLLGGINDALTSALVSTYMTDHRRNFDTENEEISPEQSVIEAIRATDEYQSIHALRPESEDERSWISNRAALAKRGGLNTENIQDFAITQATVGGDEKDIEDAAGLTQFTNTGTVRGTTLEEKMRRTATQMFQGVQV